MSQDGPGQLRTSQDNRGRPRTSQDGPGCPGTSRLISSYHLLSSLRRPELSRLASSRTSTARFPSTSWAELKLVMTRAGIPRQRSTGGQEHAEHQRSLT